MKEGINPLFLRYIPNAAARSLEVLVVRIGPELTGDVAELLLRRESGKSEDVGDGDVVVTVVVVVAIFAWRKSAARERVTLEIWIKSMNHFVFV